VALAVTAIGVSLGIALIMTGASPRERGSGWILVIETPLVGIAVIALSRWIQKLATSGRLDLESAGRWTVSSPGWDRMKGRRFLLLWYLGTILAAVGVAITFVTPFGLVGGWDHTAGTRSRWLRAANPAPGGRGGRGSTSPSRSPWSLPF
jgi:hypothetical protein